MGVDATGILAPFCYLCVERGLPSLGVHSTRGQIHAPATTTAVCEECGRPACMFHRQTVMMPLGADTVPVLMCERCALTNALSVLVKRHPEL